VYRLGPAGFRNTFEVFEPRPGGRWCFLMHGPDGVDHPNESVFLAVEEPERIVFRHVSVGRAPVVDRAWLTALERREHESDRVVQVA
jgi:uncharacterized protein YndB with AHSA1/START domain